jgi:hypothetical protein
MDEVTNDYETRDIGMAASLYVGGAKLSEIKREPSSDRYPHGRAVFCFSDPAGVAALVQQYYRGSLTVDAKHLLSTYYDYRRLAFNKEALGK